MTESMRYALADDVVLQVADEEVLLVKLTAEDMFALNRTGAEIVQRITTGISSMTLIDELAGEYAVERDALAVDVQALLADLVRRGLLVVRDEPS